MDRQQVLEYVLDRFGTEPDFPWPDTNLVLRHRENEKWYGLIMAVGLDKLGLPGEDLVDVLTVKSDPMLIGSLRMQEGFHKAYHMNKDKWISMRLDGSAADEQIKSLLELSYDLTGIKKKVNRYIGRKELRKGEQHDN